MRKAHPKGMLHTVYGDYKEHRRKKKEERRKAREKAKSEKKTKGK